MNNNIKELLLSENYDDNKLGVILMHRTIPEEELWKETWGFMKDQWGRPDKNEVRLDDRDGSKRFWVNCCKHNDNDKQPSWRLRSPEEM